MISLSSSVNFCKVVLAFSVACFCLIASLNNVIDHETNLKFVQHVLSMDSMKPWFYGGDLNSRAISSPSIQLLVFWFITISEAVAGLVCLVGSIMMAKNINSPNFSKGQAIYIIGGTLALFIWYFSFAVIASEWFAMWANQWNGQSKSYLFSCFILLSMCFVILPSPKIDDEQL